MISSTDPQPQTTATVQAPHDGRSRCWRPDCRAAWGSYRTVTWQPSWAIARCHGARYRRHDLDLAAELAAHADVVVAA